MDETKTTYSLLLGKPKLKRPLGRPKHRWEGNIKMYLGEIGLGCMDAIGLAEERDKWRAVMNAVMNIRVP
jgi:hypothetical protein